MGRIRDFELDHYFSYNAATQLSTCKFQNCRRTFKGNISGNLKRHLKLVHRKTFEKDINADSPGQVEPSKLNITKNEFISCLVGLISTENLSYKTVDSVYFKTLVQMFEDEFNVDINSRNISGKINLASNQIKHIIINELKNKMINLKFDFVTKMHKCFIGVHAQFMINNEMHIRTLGMFEYRKDHPLEYLKQLILNILAEYSISSSHVYCTTTDNGMNMVQNMHDSNYGVEVNENDELNENTIHSVLGSVLSYQKCAAHHLRVSAQDVVENISTTVNLIRNDVQIIRNIFNHLTTNVPKPPMDKYTCWKSTYEMMLSLTNNKQFFENLAIEYRDANLTIADENSWKCIEEFVMAFKSIYTLTQHLQNVKLYTIGDFYRDWMECELELRELCKNRYSDLLIEAMYNQKNIFMNNNMILGAIYLDPRFNYARSEFLTDLQKEKAVAHLENTYKSYQNITRHYPFFEKVEQPEEQNFTELPVESKYDINNSSSSSFDLPQNNSIAIKLEGSMNNSNSSFNLSPMTSQTQQQPKSRLEGQLVAKFGEAQKKPILGNTVQRKLISLCNEDRLPVTDSILNYWNEKQFIDPLLFELAQIVLACPVTQTSVKRTFSALELMTSSLRDEINIFSLNDMLIVKLNVDLLYKIEFEQ